MYGTTRKLRLQLRTRKCLISPSPSYFYLHIPHHGMSLPFSLTYLNQNIIRLYLTQNTTSRRNLASLISLNLLTGKADIKLLLYSYICSKFGLAKVGSTLQLLATDWYNKTYSNLQFVDITGVSMKIIVFIHSHIQTHTSRKLKQRPLT